VIHCSIIPISTKKISRPHPRKIICDYIYVHEPNRRTQELFRRDGDAQDIFDRDDVGAVAESSVDEQRQDDAGGDGFGDQST